MMLNPKIFNIHSQKKWAKRGGFLGDTFEELSLIGVCIFCSRFSIKVRFLGSMQNTYNMRKKLDVIGLYGVIRTTVPNP